MRIKNKQLFFIKYLLSLPIRDFKKSFRSDSNSNINLKHPKTWLWIVGFFFIFTFVFFLKFNFYLFLLLISILIWSEWQKGTWKYEFRQNLGIPSKAELKELKKQQKEL